MSGKKSDFWAGDFILRMKHWQIFSIIFGFRLVDVLIYPQPEPIDHIMTAIWFSLYFGWLLFTGLAFHKLLHSPLKSLWIGYWIGFVLFFCYVTLFGFIGGEEQISSWQESGWINLFSTLFVILCMSLVCMFFASALNKIEAPGENRNREIIGDFFLFFLWPIGIWILQPRLNKLIDTKN